jgi:hypothetical protein
MHKDRLCEYVGDSFYEHGGLQYFQSHLVKQQATEKKLFWIREK